MLLCSLRFRDASICRRSMRRGEGWGRGRGGEEGGEGGIYYALRMGRVLIRGETVEVEWREWIPCIYVSCWVLVHASFTMTTDRRQEKWEGEGECIYLTYIHRLESWTGIKMCIDSRLRMR